MGWREKVFLVEQRNEAVFSESYRTVMDDITALIELDVAKAMPRAPLESASGGKRKKGRRNDGGGEKSE